jgi:hypothetical protein
MPGIQINASAYGTPGEVVAVEDGQVVWTGPIEALGEAGGFDALFCHDDDETRLLNLLHRRAKQSATRAERARSKAK